MFRDKNWLESTKILNIEQYITFKTIKNIQEH